MAGAIQALGPHGPPSERDRNPIWQGGCPGLRPIWPPFCMQSVFTLIVFVPCICREFCDVIWVHAQQKEWRMNNMAELTPERRQFYRNVKRFPASSKVNLINVVTYMQENALKPVVVSCLELMSCCIDEMHTKLFDHPHLWFNKIQLTLMFYGQ